MNPILSFKYVNYHAFRREDACLGLVIHNISIAFDDKHATAASNQFGLYVESVFNFSGHTSRFGQVISYFAVFDANSHESRIHTLAFRSRGSIIPLMILSLITITISATAQISFGGYGEVSYRNVENATDSFDVHRVVLYTGYEFDETYSFSAEIEFEHGDEIHVEFAHIDGNYSEALNVRAGHILLPMGFMNQTHEPTTFWSAKRPIVERFVIPSTWHENGIGVWGSDSNLTWQAYFVNGTDDGFDIQSSGLRGGRQNGERAAAEKMGFTARLDYQVAAGLQIGTAIYTGGTNNSTSSGAEHHVQVVEAHVQYDNGPLRVRGLFADASVENSAQLPTTSTTDDIDGWYVEAGYDLLSSDDDTSLTPFARVEQYDLGEQVDINMVGIAFQPNLNIIYKFDLQNITSETGGQDSDNIEFTIGWSF